MINLYLINKNRKDFRSTSLHLMEESCYNNKFMIDYLTKFCDELLIYKDGDDNAVIILDSKDNVITLGLI